MLLVFIVGWFGANWWPGQWVDAPKPGGGGDPWWLRPVAGIIGGIAAVAVDQMVLTQAAHIEVNSLLGVTAVLATGNVVGGLVGAVAGMARK